MNFWRKRMSGPGRRVTIAGYGQALLLFLILAVFPPWGQDALAQGAEEVKVILERMGRLERDIRALNLSLARSVPRPASSPFSQFKPRNRACHRQANEAISGRHDN